MVNPDAQFERYSRQIFMDEIGVAGQRKINAAKVLVIGAGGIGSPVLAYLAAAGVGHLAVADFDVLEIHNLNRQIIHAEQQVGKLKTESAANFVAQLNSSIHFEPIAEKITAANVEELLSPYDIIVEGSDNFTCRYLVNDTCVGLAKPLVYGSIFGFEGQVALLNHEGSKDLRAFFPEAPNPEDAPTCDSKGVLGPLPGLVGSMMAMLVLQVICGLAVPKNQLCIIDSLNWRFSQITA